MLEDSSLIDREKIVKENRNEQFLYFNHFLKQLDPPRYQWKYFAFSLYRLRDSIEKFENYPLRTFLREKFQLVLDEFLFLMKNIIRNKVEKQKALLNDEHSSDNITENDDESSWNLDELKKKIIDFHETLSNLDKEFSLCKTDFDRIEKLIETINEIQWEKKMFDDEDEKKLRIIAIEENLKKKSDRRDLIQLKNYFDDQMKNFVANIKEMQRLKSTDESNRESRGKKLANQSVRPFLTFELDVIRKYQRQALIRSSDGAIPIYRRQAWAAANLFSNRSLQFVRYTQDRVADQVEKNRVDRETKRKTFVFFLVEVRRLIGFHPADTFANSNSRLTMKNKNSKLKIHSARISRHEIDIVGKDNRLYRGQIQSCRTLPKKKNEKPIKSTFSTDEKSQINSISLEQFDPTSRTNAEKYLFDYFDWYNEFQHRDLPDEINEKLFDHWKTIICAQQSCHCDSSSKTISDQRSSTSIMKQSSSECQDQSETNISLSMKYSRSSLEEKTVENHQKVDSSMYDSEIQMIDLLPMNNEITTSTTKNNDENLISNSFSDEFDDVPSMSIEKNRSDDPSMAKLFSNNEEFDHTMRIPIDSRLFDDPTGFRQCVLDHNHQNSSETS